MAWVQMWQIAIICYAHIIIQNKKGTNMKKQNAFTLAELLVSILIISVILTLLAPVITKRAKENISINGGSTNKINTRLFIYNKSDSNCSEISGVNNFLSCNFTIPSGVNRINAIAVSGGGGGAGATQPTIETGKKLTVANTTAKTSKTQELTITNGMKNIVISELIGSGAGGGGASTYESTEGSFAPTSQSDCDQYNAVYMPPAYNGGTGVCVTKYNGGDRNGPTIPSSVRTATAGSGSCTAKSCCWKGTTVLSGTDTSSYGSFPTCSTVGGYSGCTRTVCTWYAADDICKNHSINGVSGWRLPTIEEMRAWAKIENLALKIGIYDLSFWANDLLLCNWGDGRYNMYAYCAPRTGENRCKGARSDDCSPYGIWSGTPGGSQDEYMGLWLSNIFTADYAHDYDEAYSVRCVLGGTKSTFALSGGGGGAGAYIKNYQIPNDVISSNIGGKIKLFSAAGGSGGNSASSQGSNASNGSNGNTSYIEIYDKDNVLKWGIRALGGNYGYGATSTAAGNGGAQTSANSCQLYENGVWKSINCTGVGIRGTNGNKVESASSTNTATGGSGGGSMYNSSTVIGGGSGGSISSANGYNGSVYGAGGGGATIVFDSSNNVTKGIGGNGANGVAEITYDLVYSAAAGGGGGGGAFAYIKNIPVVSENTYTITVGAGGLGGTISSNGSDGGEASINAGGTIYTLTGGKGGKAGTSATSSSTVVQGAGGLAGVVSANVTSAAGAEYKNGENGENGGTFTQDDIHANSLPYGGSFGGIGGASGLDTQGGCGGLFIDSSICTNNTVNGTNTTFTTPTISNGNIDYAQAGAGGGGGGWSENTSLYPSPGSGAQGQGGYVLLMWEK